MTASTTPRSYLFVPGNRPDRFVKASQSGADRVILDLEDAVAEADKDAARQQVAEYLGAGGAGIVRINATHSRWLDDVMACRQPGLQGVILPKAESADLISRIVQLLPAGVKVLPLIETARGMKSLDEIASTVGVERLVFGTVDFRTEMGIEGDDEELLYFRSMIVLASKAAGKAAPIDGVTVSINDADELQRACIRGRRLGFGAKLCVHPSQVQAVNKAFGPSDEQIAWAVKILHTAKSSGGVFKLDGEMVDAPVIARAATLLKEAGRATA
ncbi:citrate lyase subunit beta-like protein (plasmid) [Cupriavidus necator N-1]|uniref:Citrate lyase subunit beta-like protein n=1 Tax=Cupriavidus necator (strain ATCC 43291 / DSM 13513 / CCUG 52238 / LMG 8453 / N-1) TaxID=1042878 RepID=F8GUI7_CUPNN|nr:CoA ester lyase [Cupriavidus necator]AEI82391.1 citrate lyase subunit beta-like protein [Cupriavidus necator N-1]MDX6007400.1 CoA ester lyase [Cupriavidus necator]